MQSCHELSRCDQKVVRGTESVVASRTKQVRPKGGERNRECVVAHRTKKGSSRDDERSRECMVALRTKQVRPEEVQGVCGRT